MLIYHKTAEFEFFKLQVFCVICFQNLLQFQNRKMSIVLVENNNNNNNNHGICYVNICATNDNLVAVEIHLSLRQFLQM
ncbi:hypothetical protein T11_15644 [Trichinella zimbabwensis]|uniref:Uncharacterized protein n=1 Tax=Trichinella zimbabwensis TaxID=268475 RepID=A0A0V1GU83_9BILA|nr:hypothetical protein T11_15644 [Trichinella zimbabwensis]